MQHNTAWGGFFRKRECWVPTWRGWMALALSAILLGGVAVATVHPFLSLTVRPEPDVLVIEGWIPDYALVEGWNEFQRGHYSVLLTVGGPFRSGVHLDPDDDYADLAAYKLRKYMGQTIPVWPVRCPAEKRDRTFTCGVTVKAWLEQHHQNVKTVTIVTVGPHARRSRLLYEKAFGPGIPIGVVAVTNEEYDSRHWWKYSEGVKEIVSEGVAYLYDRLAFSS